jgi:chloride channel protein, CIC family
VVAGAMHAPLTAILMLFELTRDAYVLLPVMLAAVVATVTAQLAEADSIYTTGLRKKGFRIGGGRDLSVLRRVPVSSVRLTPLPPEPVYPSDPLSKLVALHAYYDVPDFVVVDQAGNYVGMVTGRDMRTALIDREAVPLLLVAELLRTDLPTLTAHESLDSTVEKFGGKGGSDASSLALVEDGTMVGAAGISGRPIGLVMRSAVMQRYQRALEES